MHPSSWQCSQQPASVRRVPLFRDQTFELFFDQFVSPLVMAAHQRSEAVLIRLVVFDERKRFDEMRADQAFLAKHKRVSLDNMDKMQRQPANCMKTASFVSGPVIPEVFTFTP